jgi:nucleoside-diphosphate-sugar epimerase
MTQSQILFGTCPLAVVIGGSGFIGRNLVELLLREGWSVRIFSRYASWRHAAKVECIRANVTDADALSSTVSGSNVVFYLATGGGSDWASFEREVVGGVISAARACLQHGRQRLIYSSSIAALHLGQELIIKDDTQPDKKPLLRSLYSRAKILAEQKLKQMYVDESLPIVILRPGVVIGDRHSWNHSAFGQWSNDISCFGWGHGATYLPLVLVKDVASAFLAAGLSENIEGRTFNIVGDVRLSSREFIQFLSKYTGRRFSFHSRGLLRLYASSVLSSFLRSIIRRSATRPLFREISSRTQRATFDCSGAKLDLGWHPEKDLAVFLIEAIRAHISQAESQNISFQ